MTSSADTRLRPEATRVTSIADDAAGDLGPWGGQGLRPTVSVLLRVGD